MSAWTGDEAFSPFDEAGEMKDDLPADLVNFIEKFDISKRFTVEILKFENQDFAGNPANLGMCEQVIPSYESLVKLHGIGYYGLKCCWTPRGGRPKSEILRVSLQGAHWKKVHAMAEKIRREERVAEVKEEVEVESIRRQAGLFDGAPMNPMDGFFETMTKMKSAGMMGGQGGGDLGAVCGMMGQMMTAMVGMMMTQSTNQMNLVLAIINKNGSGGTSEMVESIKALRELTLLTQAPAEKSWVETVSSALAQNAPDILKMFQKDPSERAQDPAFQEMHDGLKKTRGKAQIDPQFLTELVRHMDEKIKDPGLVDNILSGFINVKRPGATQPPPQAPPKAAAPQAAPLRPKAPLEPVEDAEAAPAAG